MQRSLRSIPFFSDLTDEILEAISRRLHREHYHKGAIIFSEGEAGDCMYLIESGQVKVFVGQDRQEKVLAYLGPGNFFGETALLIGERRTANVAVVLDVELLVLRKEDLDELLLLHPTLTLELSRELSRRLGNVNQAPAQREEFKIVATVGAAAPSLARHLARVTGEDVFLLDLGGLANVLLDQAGLARDQVFLARGGSMLDAEALPGRLSTLIQQYYWVLLAIPPFESPLTLKALELADRTIALGTAAQGWIKDLVSKGYWQADDAEGELARTARRLSQRRVGLALSSGNARGMAHIGVIKVFEREGIPIDMIAGTSAGAVFGSLFAAGRTIDGMIEFAVSVQRQYNLVTGFRMWDFRIPPRSGLIKGNMVLGYLRKWLEDKSFDDLRIPLYIIATDLISGEEIVFDRGPVAEAVRASMSVIGILEPASVDGRYLIDGGSVNPVPTQLLADRGVNVIVASNVIPGLEARLHRKAQKREGRPPSAIGILTGAMEIMESEIIRSRMGPVDVLIQPDVAQYGTLEYDKVHEIIQRGEEAATQQIPRIRQLLAPCPRRLPHA